MPTALKKRQGRTVVEMDLKDVVEMVEGRLAGRRLEGCIGGVSTDTRSLQRGELFVALKGERFDGHEFLARAAEAGAAGVIISDRGKVPKDFAADVAVVEVDDTMQGLGRLAAGYRRRIGGKVIAITGSCGKTALKEMLGQVLCRHMKGRVPQASFNNQIGVPMTLLAAGAADDFVILEMGTNAPGEIAYLASVGRPDIGVVTLVAEAHLAGLGDLDAIAAEKSALVESLPADGLAVLNADDERVMGMAGQCRARVVTFGVEAEADYRAEGVELTPDGLSFRAKGCRVRMPVLAGYYAGLAMATMAAAEAMGVPPEDVAQDLADYKPPPMRLERKVFGDVIVISDAHNANWRSWLAALEVLKLWPRRNKVVFAGDMLEMGAESGRLHRALGEEIAKSGVSRLVTVGAESAETRRGAIAAGLGEDATLHVADSATAADEAGSVVNRGEVVLVKGSRRMAMERVVVALSAKFAGGG